MKQITQMADSEKESSVLRDIISSLLDPSLKDRESLDSDLQLIAAAFRWTLMQTMGILTVDFFSTTCLAVLGEGHATVSSHSKYYLYKKSEECSKAVHGVLGLLSARVPVMNAQARKSVSSIRERYFRTGTIYMLLHAKIADNS